MSKQVSWVLELTIKAGRQADFRALAAEMSTATKASEPGTLSYEWGVSADGATCHLYERYTDSDATLVHLKNFGEKFAARFMELLTPTRFTIYGHPNDAVRSALAPFAPVYFESVGGFTR